MAADMAMSKEESPSQDRSRHILSIITSLFISVLSGIKGKNPVLILHDMGWQDVTEGEDVRISWLIDHTSET